MKKYLKTNMTCLNLQKLFAAKMVHGVLGSSEHDKHCEEEKNTEAINWYGFNAKKLMSIFVLNYFHGNYN